MKKLNSKQLEEHRGKLALRNKSVCHHYNEVRDVYVVGARMKLKPNKVRSILRIAGYDNVNDA